MNPLFYQIASPIIKTILGKGITGKPFMNEKIKIFYEKQQHLNFAFKSKITYEKNICDKISKYIQPGDAIFDIGSNIGQYALTFSQLTGESGKVFCYEPDFKNFAFLQFNVAINHLKNVTVTNAGMGKEPGTARFFRDTSTGGRRGSMNKEYVGDSFQGEELEIKITSIDKEIEKFGVPDFVKIDVEGLEFEVLKGLREIPKQTTFFIEVRTETKNDIFNLFQKNNFTCLLLDGKEAQVMKESSSIPDFANLLFVHS